jgi:hypothetical protein
MDGAVSPWPEASASERCPERQRQLVQECKPYGMATRRLQFANQYTGLSVSAFSQVSFSFYRVYILYYYISKKILSAYARIGILLCFNGWYVGLDLYISHDVANCTTMEDLIDTTAAYVSRHSLMFFFRSQRIQSDAIFEGVFWRKGTRTSLASIN